HLIEGLAPGGSDVQVVEIRHFFSVSHCSVIALHDNAIVANQARGPQEPPPAIALVEIAGGVCTFALPFPFVTQAKTHHKVTLQRQYGRSRSHARTSMCPGWSGALPTEKIVRHVEERTRQGHRLCQPERRRW